MNSAVIPQGKDGIFVNKVLTPEAYHAILKKGMADEKVEVKSCLGYPQNIELLKRWFDIDMPLSRIKADINTGDLAIYMRLKERMFDPNKKGMPVSEDKEDWEFGAIVYILNTFIVNTSFSDTKPSV